MFSTSECCPCVICFTAPTSSIIPVNMDTRPRFQSEYPRQDGSGCCFSAGMLHSAQELLHLPPVFLLPVRRTALGQCTPAPVEQRRFPVLPSSVSLRLPEECCRVVPDQVFHKLYKVNVTVPFVQTNHSAPSLSIYRLPFRVGAAGRKDGRDLFCCCDHLCLQWCPQLSIADDANWIFPFSMWQVNKGSSARMVPTPTMIPLKRCRCC